MCLFILTHFSEIFFFFFFFFFLEQAYFYAVRYQHRQMVSQKYSY